MTIKNRGALSNPEGRFEKRIKENYDDGWGLNEETDPPLPALDTQFFPEKAKSIITRNDSPDIGFLQSINPYRGCEHGCIYCYARPAHAYMNLSPGLDFETKIFHKVDAAKLLEQELAQTKYIPSPIMLGANTDPYQPGESKLKITRSILETLNRYHHPVAIITKSSLIERDLELIAKMAKQKLASVAISVTTLKNELKRTLEPRTSSPLARLRAIRKLSEAGIPVRVMVAPIIPLINDSEMERILSLAADAGATHASYVLIRLPHEVKDLFKEWLKTHYPERANHVINFIKDMRGGKEYDSTFGQRMRGQGEYANLLASRFQLACKRSQLNRLPTAILDTKQFVRPKDTKQFDLFAPLKD